MTMKQKKTYLIDIDSTVMEGPDYYTSKPIHSRIVKVNRLYDAGNIIIYHTARGATTGLNWFELTYAQLKDAGAKFHELRMGKPHYDVWVDDKAINSEDFFSYDD